MNTLPPRRAETLWLLAGGALLLLALAWAVTTTFTKHRQAAARLAEIEPRHARLAGLLEGSERFVQADATLRANLAQFVHPIDADASQIGNTALQRVRDLATARGLRVSAARPPPRARTTASTASASTCALKANGRSSSNCCANCHNSALSSTPPACNSAPSSSAGSSRTHRPPCTASSTSTC